ncbi:MAG: hypothetical protein V4478_03060 [Patescibacteria group bacterium]
MEKHFEIRQQNNANMKSWDKELKNILSPEVKKLRERCQQPCCNDTAITGTLLLKAG